MTQNLNNFLRSVFYDPSNVASFSGVNKLFNYTRSFYPDVTEAQIKQFLSEQDAYTFHKPVRRHWKRNRIIVKYPNETWQADLCDMTQVASANDGFRYILTVIDLFSKFAYAIPVRNKTALTVLEAFKTIFRINKPTNLQTDKGGEFVNHTLKSFLKKHDINFFVSQDEVIKCSVVERFNRTLKSKIFKFFTANETKRYIDVLPTLVDTYNRTKHRSIGMAPVDVSIDNQKQVFQNLYGGKSLRQLLKERSNKDNVPIGQQVRLSKHQSTFKKGYEPAWTGEVFKINTIFPAKQHTLYQVKDSGEETIIGKLYPQEFQPVTVKPTSNPVIEKVLNKRNYRGDTYYYVKWKGYPAFYNSWLLSSEILHHLHGDT